MEEDSLDGKAGSGDENTDPNSELRESKSVSKIKTFAAKERTHPDAEARLVEANRMKKRLKQ